MFLITSFKKSQTVVATTCKRAREFGAHGIGGAFAPGWVILRF